MAGELVKGRIVMYNTGNEHPALVDVWLPGIVTKVNGEIISLFVFPDTYYRQGVGLRLDVRHGLTFGQWSWPHEVPH